ncbi:hypothetical protein TRSC58_06315 [Trypanosoma rangeli SC58]|uniref:Uncharacterized protein n=1 Tax=Trypanosoma rangeli SC58 TaxID=429131 RepID=A0A061IYA1_TRYRA|nr:hypothetical protein TRSC58_06315 [Trypanosoma rangeli SC58]
MMRNQLRSQDALLQDKVDAITRLRDELASSTERGRGLQEKNIELRDQLGKTDAAREKLAQELKQSQDALIHLQRSTSVNGRHWSVLASTSAGNNLSTGLGMGLSNSFGSAANDIYREFNKNAMTTVRNAGCLPAQGPLDIPGVPAAHSQNAVNASESNLQGVMVGEPKHVSKTSQDPPHPANNKAANSFGSGAQIVSGNSVANLPHASESHIMNGKCTRQPLDATTVNVALNSRNHMLAAKNFFNDGGDKANRTLNTASFMEKTPGAMAKAAAAPSAYF